MVQTMDCTCWQVLTICSGKTPFTLYCSGVVTDKLLQLPRMVALRPKMNLRVPVTILQRVPPFFEEDALRCNVVLTIVNMCVCGTKYKANATHWIPLKAPMR